MRKADLFEVSFFNEELGVTGYETFIVGDGVLDVPNLSDNRCINADQMNPVGEGCSPLGRRHEVTEGEASPPRNAPPVTFPIDAVQMRSKSTLRNAML